MVVYYAFACLVYGVDYLVFYGCLFLVFIGSTLDCGLCWYYYDGLCLLALAVVSDYLL